MYRLLKPIRFQWSVTHGYDKVNPYFELHDRGRVHILWLELLSDAGVCQGLWHRSQLPHMLMAHLCTAINAAYIDWELLDDEQLDGLLLDLDM